MFVERYKSDGKTVFAEEEMNRQAFFFFNYLIDVGYIKGSSSISGDKVGSITITQRTENWRKRTAMAIRIMSITCIWMILQF